MNITILIRVQLQILIWTSDKKLMQWDGANESAVLGKLMQLLLPGIFFFFPQYVHIYVHQWCVILVKWGTNGKKQTCNYSCHRAKHGALHACSISLLFKGFERGLSWFEMTCNVWTVFCFVSQCRFTWNSYFIPEFPCRAFTKFHQMWDIIMHCAVGFICVCRC